MTTQSRPTTPHGPLGTIWRHEPFARSPRPWLLLALSFASIALVIVASFGPWLYVERGAEWALEVETLPGTANDGVFSLFFAVIAAVLLLVTLIRPDLWIYAVGAFVAMLLCTMVGLFDWVIFDPMDIAQMPGTTQVSLIRVEWGLKLLTFAAPAGAISTFLLARHLLRGDY